MRSEWTSYKIGEIFELVNGYAFKSGDFISSGIPVLKIKNIKPNNVVLDDLSYVSVEVASRRNDKAIRRGDILITMSGNRFDGSKDTWVGKVAYFDISGHYMLNQRVGVLRPREGVVIDRKCAAYFLSSDDYQKLFISIATSSGGQANLSPAQILGEQLHLPPIEEQARISELLGGLDDRITLLRETNATLEAIAQALFKSWFVDFDPVRAKAEGRQPEAMDATTAALFPDSFEESELGLVPKGWRAGMLSDLASFQNGYAFKSQDWTDTGHPVVKIGDVKPGLIDFSGCSRVDPATVIGLERFKLSRGDVLVGMTGYVGETGLVPRIEPDAYINQRVGRLVTRAGLSDIGMVYCAVRDPAYKAYAEAQSHGSAQANVSGAALLAYPLVITSPDLLCIFNRIAETLLESVLSNHEQAQILTQLRDTLLPRLISGQLRLPEAESLLENAL